MKLKRLEERIRKRVVGQNHVIRPIAASIQQSTAGLSDPTKPVGSFLLVGDSGVATDLAKTLVNELFHDEKFLIMMDMINYSDGCSISNFLGAPGYVCVFHDRSLFFICIMNFQLHINFYLSSISLLKSHMP